MTDPTPEEIEAAAHALFVEETSSDVVTTNEWSVIMADYRKVAKAALIAAAKVRLD